MNWILPVNWPCKKWSITVVTSFREPLQRDLCDNLIENAWWFHKLTVFSGLEFSWWASLSNMVLNDSLQWRHKGCDSASNHQPHDCFLNRLFRHRSKKHQSSASLAFVRGIHRRPVNSPHKWPATRKMFPFDDVIMEIGGTTFSRSRTCLERDNPLKQLLVKDDEFVFKISLSRSPRYRSIFLAEILTHASACYRWNVGFSKLL